MNIPVYYKKTGIAGIIAMAMIWALPLSVSESPAQVDKGKSARLQVGTIAAPPFAMKTADGRWEGLSIDIWQAVASAMGVQYEIREYNTMGRLVNAVERGELDVVIALAATEKREIILDLSQSYCRSGSAIAVSGDKSGRGLSGILGRIGISEFFEIIGLLILLWMIAGAALWIFEGRRNREMFGGGPMKGIGHAVWWAAVTMTTVGYGDKAPVTFGGRVIAVVWMFCSIVLIAGFTASISASLTAEKLAGKVRGMQDLPHVRVGSVPESETMQRLVELGISPVPFLTARDGLQAIADDKIDAFVFDEIVLKHIVKTDFPGRLHVLAGTFDNYYVSMGMPNGSLLREPLDRALLKFMQKDEWNRMVAMYIGSSR